MRLVHLEGHLQMQHVDVRHGEMGIGQAIAAHGGIGADVLEMIQPPVRGGNEHRRGHFAAAWQMIQRAQQPLCFGRIRLP